MDDDVKNVVITDIKMPFLSMVIFMVKWMLASIPAFIIVGAIFVGISMGLQMAGLIPTMSSFSNLPMNIPGTSGTPSSNQEPPASNPPASNPPAASENNP